jgi:hypothetical protein
MELETVVAVDHPADAVRARAQAFLAARGYRRTDTGFVRGSLWGTFTALNPRKWKAHVSVTTLASGHCGLRFDVNTTGHVTILPSERKFWEDELEATACVVRGDPAPDLDVVEAETKAAGWRTVQVMLAYAISLATAFGILQVVLARKGVVLPPGFTGIGAGVGAVLGLRTATKPLPPPT